MRTIKGASLLEAIVAAVIFMTVFAAVMEVMPRLSVRDDDALLVAEAEYRTARACDKYNTGLWPCGEYTERYEWGEITVRIAPYRDFGDIQVVTATARITGSRKRVSIQNLIECPE